MFIPYLCFRFYCTFIQYEITAYYHIDLHVQCVEVLLTYPDRKGSNFGVWQHKRLLTEKLPPAKTSSGILYNIFNIIFPFLQIFVIIHIHGRKEVIKPRAFPTIQACTIPLNLLKSVLIYALNTGRELPNIFTYFLLIERLILIKIYIRENLFRCKIEPHYILYSFIHY